MKPGQKLVCINKKGWVDIDKDGVKSNGPKYNEIVTFLHNGKHSGFLVLDEYRFVSGDLDEDEYWESAFRPIISDEVLHAELNEILNLERV